MTVGELRRAIRELPDEAAVVAYVDWEGAAERPLGLLEERLYICGHFEVKEVETEQTPEASRGVIVLGQTCLW